ncbi:DUF2062 domain-containing protein [Paenibacillus sediminis]|uniref:Glycosyltransferase n=1 Tax=Paenibacillus sediminis TaxID=664909 RepID=A0ABS4H184_9BACL|nr:DUF2062 domain-containing protein [Paenibacillus sediminis]MBP1935875.1 cellulose synthase/poly-beta-1,6-N-acetylglucosamine synthase-like glycosyltransferase/spore germination protein YaaH/peptidoglycan/xylan/chitin deacetylase (PgdA/CDA1 family)/uncharacterized protein (DUF2062 family) [Paenibacillus sediminis]
MFKKIVKYVSSALFSPITTVRGTFAGSLGLFLGMLPLFGIRTVVLLIISILFRLNIFALFLGVMVTMILPIVHVLSFTIADRLAGYDISFFSLHYLGFNHLKQWTVSGRYHLIGSIIAGLLLSILFAPFFRWLFNLPTHMKNRPKQPFIFHDELGRRWMLLKRFGLVIITLSILVVSVFGISISINPFLPSLGFHDDQHLSKISPINEKLSESSLIKQLREEEQKNPTHQIDYRRHHKFNLANQPLNKQEVYGFYVNWDENSWFSLNRNIKSMTTVIPEWYFLKPDLSINDQSDNRVVQLAKSHNVEVMPLVSNYYNDKWDSDLLHKLFSSKAMQNKVINELYQSIISHGYSGINIDFEGVNPADKNNLTLFMSALYKQFHSHGLRVTEDVPASDPAFDYGALSNYVDRVIVMLYDEHYASGKPGPIASDQWFNQSIDNLDIPPNKMIVSMGNYGYDWAEDGSGPADIVTFGDIMQEAQQSHLKIQYDDQSNNPYIRYKDGDVPHIIWFLDGATAYNEQKSVSEDGLKGVAVWRLGSEDPTIWNVVSHPGEGIESIKKLISPDPVHFSGDGEIIRITSVAQDGRRDIKLDNDGYVSNEVYSVFPAPFEIKRYGKPKDKEVALTFDDGPDGKYTPEILDILKQNHVHAAFFVVGENAELHPDLIERIYKEGNELGNHTFTHPDVASVSPLRTKMELNATQRLVQEITGRSMTLFRPPYVADAEPSTPDELLPVLRAQEMGYTMVGELIDPEDWSRPSSAEIVRRVLSQLPQGNIILLHDAGGNRDNTVKALPIIIKELKARGYTFTSVSHLAGLGREDVMPPVQTSDNMLMMFDRLTFTALSDWINGLTILFYSAIGIGIFRLLFLLALSYRQKRKYRPLERVAYNPFVSVVIAAYNEEKVISMTLQSILKSDYPNFEIVVVDDGSTDQTAKVIQEQFGGDDRVRLVTKPNGGKSSAINRGFQEAYGEIVVALDADTQIAPDAISLLVRHFKDENVAAVSGNVKVGNVHNMLTTWQHVEYVTGFNLERRAFSEINCITVVPGAIGAWRKSMVAEIGYFSEDTLAEDTDITLTLLQKGHRITFEEKAYAYTEAPEDVKSLIKQRYRWTYGTLQSLWKHRKALFNRKHKALGFVGLPNMWLFQYIFQSLSPLTDILFIISLFSGHPLKAVVFYGIFFVVDLFTAYYAFRLEKENPKALLGIFLQRIIYRQFMMYVVLKSIYSAVKGVMVGWNKLKRKGNINSLHTTEPT